MHIFFILVTTLITALCGYLRHLYTYWEQRNVPQLKMHFPLGNFFKLRSIHHDNIMHEVYAEFRGKCKLAGTYLYTKPIAIILDLELVKSILIKDFNKFTDRFERRSTKEDPLSLNLFSAHGEKWRGMRMKLTPTFTSAKMKLMFPTVVTVAQQLEQAFSEHLAKSVDGSIELHDINGRYTTDVIGHCAFGLECNSLKDPNVEFRHIGQRVFYPRFLSVRWRVFLVTYWQLTKYISKRFPADVEEFVVRLVRDTVQMREKQNIQRNDFINLLIELKNSKDVNGMPGLTVEEIAAQVFIFFVAGFETSSSNMTFALYELAKNPHVQDKVRAEILHVLEKHDGKLSYEAMMDMTYLDQIITETVRKYPPLSALTRISIDEYEVPGTNIKLEKGSRIHIPIKQMHYDPQIYEHPNEFRPERFDTAEVQKRHPQAFLGFGDGPRNCIGLRFGRMQVRVGLITLLKNFRFSPNEKTPKKLEMSNNSFVLVPHGGVWLKAERI